MSPRAYDPSSFLASFLDELGRRGRCRPCYPERAWHRALERAEELDTIRMLASHYRKLDAVQYCGRRVVFYEKLHGSTIGKMNGVVLHELAAEPELWRDKRNRGA